MVARRDESDRRCRCHSREGDAADEDRLSRQSEQSDRHLSAVRRGQAARRRSAAASSFSMLDAAYAEYVDAQRLCVGDRTRVDARQCRDDADLFENLWSRRPAARLVLCAACRLRCVEPHSRAVQHVDGRRWQPASRRSRSRRISTEAIAHNEKWLAWLATEIAALGIGITPSVGNFLLLHFKDAGDGARRGRIPCRARPHSARGRRL